MNEMKRNEMNETKLNKNKIIHQIICKQYNKKINSQKKIIKFYRIE